jgi:hypothetical protein
MRHSRDIESRQRVHSRGLLVSRVYGALALGVVWS